MRKLSENFFLCSLKDHWCFARESEGKKQNIAKGKSEGADVPVERGSARGLCWGCSQLQSSPRWSQSPPEAFKLPRRACIPMCGADLWGAHPFVCCFVLEIFSGITIKRDRCCFYHWWNSLYGQMLHSLGQLVYLERNSNFWAYSPFLMSEIAEQPEEREKISLGFCLDDSNEIICLFVDITLISCMRTKCSCRILCFP